MPVEQTLPRAYFLHDEASARQSDAVAQPTATDGDSGADGRKRHGVERAVSALLAGGGGGDERGIRVS